MTDEGTFRRPSLRGRTARELVIDLIVSSEEEEITRLTNGLLVVTIQTMCRSRFAETWSMLYDYTMTNDVSTERQTTDYEYTALISCIRTTFVASPCQPLSPLAANKKLQVGSTTGGQPSCTDNATMAK
jgi:hypothetical protein